jgi:hypothetical protein
VGAEDGCRCGRCCRPEGTPPVGLRHLAGGTGGQGAVAPPPCLERAAGHVVQCGGHGVFLDEPSDGEEVRRRTGWQPGKRARRQGWCAAWREWGARWFLVGGAVVSGGRRGAGFGCGGIPADSGGGLPGDNLDLPPPPLELPARFGRRAPHCPASCVRTVHTPAE